jgi:hypothetical protein
VLKRTALLDYVRSKHSYTQQGSVDVLLHEGLLADAIALLEIEKPIIGSIPKALHLLASSKIEYLTNLSH